MQKEDVQTQLIAILEDMTSDWDLDFDGGITPETRLIGDLSFESIEIVQLMVRVEQQYKLKNLASEKLIMNDGRYVPELTVAEVVDFLATEMNGQ